MQSLELIGEHDPLTDRFTARAFERDGVAVMHVAVDQDGVWRFSGGGDVAPAAPPVDRASTAAVRATFTVDTDRMHAFWERTEDGTDWLSWMDVLLLRDENPPDWQEMPPVDGPAADAPEPLRALDVVAGAWSLHRSPGAVPRGAAAFTWLVGGRVLVGRVEVRDDATTPPQHALVLCRWDEPSRTCVAHVFDAGGGHSTYRVSTDGNEVRLEGSGGVVTGWLDPSTGELGYAWTVTDDGDATPSQPGAPGTAPS